MEIYIHLRPDKTLHTMVLKNTIREWTFIIAVGYAGGQTYSEFSGKFKMNDEDMTEGYYSNSLGIDYWEFRYSDETGSDEIYNEMNQEDAKNLYRMVEAMKEYLIDDELDAYSIKQNLPIEFNSDDADNMVFYQSKNWSAEFIKLASRLWEISLRFD